jgi:hypothetical protein
MKVNSTVALTFVLLALMFGAGLVSAAWGLVVGREALKGITQPDTRPANNLAQRKGNTPRREEVVILKEEDIINSVKARMSGGAGKAAPSPAPAKPAEPKPPVETQKPVDAASNAESTESESFINR